MLPLLLDGVSRQHLILNNCINDIIEEYKTLQPLKERKQGTWNLTTSSYDYLSYRIYSSYFRFTTPNKNSVGHETGGGCHNEVEESDGNDLRVKFSRRRELLSLHNIRSPQIFISSYFIIANHYYNHLFFLYLCR